MNLEDLRAVQAKERETDDVQELRESFYEDVAAYIDDLKAERNGVAQDAEDPFDAPAVRKLTDEVKSAERAIESIYDRRMGKLVKQASLVAVGMPADETGLTVEEKALFSELVETIRDHRNHVLSVLSGDERATPPSARPEGEAAAVAGDDDPDGDTAEPDVDDDADDGLGESETVDESGDTSVEPVDESGDAPVEPDVDDEPRTTVRITQDIGDIVGVDDRDYTLKVDDVVSLPDANAKPLIERDVAEKLE